VAFSGTEPDEERTFGTLMSNFYELTTSLLSNHPKRRVVFCKTRGASPLMRERRKNFLNIKMQ
jgi:hypothetical protein